MSLRAVFFSVQVLFLVILGSLAAEGALFSSQIVTGFGVRCDLRKSMPKLAHVGQFLPKQKKERQDQKSWHANWDHFRCRRVGYQSEDIPEKERLRDSHKLKMILINYRPPLVQQLSSMAVQSDSKLYRIIDSLTTIGADRKDCWSRDNLTPAFESWRVLAGFTSYANHNLRQNSVEFGKQLNDLFLREFIQLI